MKTVFMILAHERPAVLRRLIDRLAHPDTSVIVHIDAKRNIAPFEAALAGYPGVSFVPHADRVAVNWCGFSMVRATLVLLTLAFSTNAERFMLLSGADYPVRPLPEILRTLTADREIISVDRLCHPHGDDWFDRCAFCHFFGDYPLLGLRSGHRRLQRIAAAVARRLPRRRFPIPIYYGPAWWCLTRDAVAEVLCFARTYPALVRWFANARSPDEMFFQSVLKQSTRARAIAMDATAGQASPHHRAATHYVDFDGVTTGSPKSIELQDFAAIDASGALFARKVDPDKSSALLDEIDRVHHGIAR